MESGMKIAVVVVVLLVLALIVWLVVKQMSKCKEDKDCHDHGKCVNNKCVCDNGYKGSHCQNKVAV